MENNEAISALHTPLTQGSMVARVVERIQEAMLNRELKPGDFLPSEAELTLNLGVGKSTIREAVKMLQAMGVVEVRRGQGTIISESHSESMVNPLIFQLILQNGDPTSIIDLRTMFEPAYTIMAMQNATDDDVTYIGSTIERLEQAVRDNRQSADDDLAFHYAILESTHNDYVIMIGRTILKLFHASIGVSVKTIPDVALEDHKRIFEAFRTGDENKLRNAIIRSFDGWKQSLNDTM